MVMHARKLPRINDGFSDKHQSHNTYESSKYGGGSGSKYRGSSQVAYAGPDKRDSPSTNSLRSSSPDSRSQSPRYHKGTSGNYYKREREYSSREHRDNRDGSRSPKERRRERHSDHSSRISTMKKDGTTRVGDWSEHVSSNGKRYYYNCKSEKSQWEKPQDWLDWEHHNASNRHSTSHNNKLAPHYNNSKPNYSTSSSSNVNNSNKVASYNNISLSSSQFNSSSSKGGGGVSNYTSYSSNSKNSSFITPISSANNNKSSSSISNNNNSSSQSSHSHHHGHHSSSNHHNSSHHISHHNNVSSNSSSSSLKDRTAILQEKTKLDKHSNIDSRDHHYREDHHYDKRKYAGQDMEISSGGSTPTSENRLLGDNHLHSNSGHIQTSNRHKNSNNNSSSSNNSQQPPRLLLHQSSSSNSVNNSNSGDPRHHPHHLHYNKNSELSPLTINVNNSLSGGQAGPPTPTHSESHDHVDVRKGENTNSRLGLCVTSSSNFSGNINNSNSVINSQGGVGGTLSSLSSLTQHPLPSSSINSQSWGTSSLSSSLTCQRPLHPPPALTPSLAKYYNESLISHVKEWPAENLERQCQRLSEEVHTAGSLIMTKVSADLKMARSLVRLAEIQATLHEQRVMFLRAQKKELEELGVRSQNSFMGDSTTSATSSSNNHCS